MGPRHVLRALLLSCLLLASAAPSASALGELFQPGVPSGACLGATAGVCAGGLNVNVPAGMAASPDGKSVYVVSYSGNTLQQLTRNTTTGRLTPVACVAETGGTGCATTTGGLQAPLAVVVSPDGKSAYVASYASSAVTIFARNTTTGALTPAGCISETTSEGCRQGHGLSNPFDIAITADGKSVYVPGVNTSSLAVFARTTTTGALTQTGCLATTNADGCTPARGLKDAAGVAVSADNTSVYVVGNYPGSVAIFRRSTTTLALTQPFGVAGCLSPTGDEGCQNIGDRTNIALATRVAVSPDKKSVYVIADHSISRFTRTTTTGALAAQDCISEPGDAVCADGAPLGSSSGIAITKDGKSVYVTALSAGAVTGFTRNTTTGKLTRSSCVASSSTADCTHGVGLASVFGIAATADNKSVYASSIGGNDVAAFSRVTSGATTGTLHQLDRPPAGCISFDGTGDLCSYGGPGLVGLTDVAVTKDAKSVYTASYGNAIVTTFARNATTGLLAEKGCVTSTGAAGCAAAPGLFGAIDLVPSPDSKALFVAAFTANAVAVLKRNTTTGELTSGGCFSEGTDPACASATGLGGAIGAAVSPNSKNVYVVGESPGSLAVFSRNTTTGVLTETACFALNHVDGCDDLPTLDHAYHVAVSPDAKSVYVAGGDGSVVQTFARNTTTGALTPQGCIAEGGAGPCATGRGLQYVYDVMVSPDNKSVYTASLTGAVAVLSRNTTTGALTQASGPGGCVSEPAMEGCAAGRGLGSATHVLVSPDNKSVYVASGQAGIARFSRTTTAGATFGFLSQHAGATGCVNATGNDGCATGNGLAYVFGLAISPNNKNLYSTSFSDGALAIFNRSTTASSG